MAEDRVQDDRAAKPKRAQQVFTLVVEVGRKTDDGLPEGATGAGLMVYASGVEETPGGKGTRAGPQGGGRGAAEMAGGGPP